MIKKFIIPLLILLSGCTITQRIDPVEVSKSEQLCIVEDIAVRAGFLVELKKILDEKYINYIVVDPKVANECEVKLVYMARWSWDFVLYMSYAEIRIYKDGILEGEAFYDSTNGGGRLFSKFITASVKIKELVDQLITVKHTQLFRSGFS